MKLYYTPGACSMASHIVAQEIGQPLDLVKVDLAAKTTEDGRDFLTINPNGYVPAIELDDGTILTENLGLLTFLADSPEAGAIAVPTDRVERARLIGLLSFLTSELHKAYAPFFGPNKPEGTAATDKLSLRVDYIETLLGDGRQFLLGEQFSVADAYAFVILNWSNSVGYSLDGRPTIQAYLARIASRPAVQKTLVAEGLA